MNSRSIDLFKAARFTYMAGYPMLSDEEYDVLKDEIAKEYPNLPELNSVYEDDCIDFGALERADVPDYLISAYVNNRGITREFQFEESKAFLDHDNFSIISYKTDEEVLKAFIDLGTGSYVVTPKIDGMFVSAIYERADGDTFKLVSSQSRGSADNAVDITDNIRFILKNVINIPECKEDSVKFNFEAFMTKIDSKSCGYVTCKSGAQGVLLSVVNKKPDKYSKIKLLCHGCSIPMKPEEMYKFLDRIGFETVPSAEFNLNDISDSIPITNEISQDYKIWAEDMNIEIDGIVVKKNDLPTGATITGSKIYKADTFAVKTLFWNKGSYFGKVRKIVAEQRDSDIAYTVEIEPVSVAEGGATISRLTNLRLATLITQDIGVGDTVEFEYLNGTTPKFKKKVG